MVTAYVCFVTIVFFSRAMLGLARMAEPPKSVLRYNPRSNEMEAVLNTLTFAVGMAVIVCRLTGVEGV